MKKPLKCLFCTNQYNSKQPLYTHIEQKHNELVPPDITVAQFFFNMKYNKTHGSCIMCKRETHWNEKSERYERLCDRKVCSDNFREMFKKRMMKVYNKTTLLNDPEVQKKMLEGRKISGIYKWQNGYETKFVGRYERNFLEYMEKILGWENPEGIQMPCPFVLKYTLDGKEHFYIPDVFIESLNLIIEIKASAKNNTHHFRQREEKAERAKDDVAMKSSYNFIKIEDNNFKELTNFIAENKE